MREHVIYAGVSVLMLLSVGDWGPAAAAGTARVPSGSASAVGAPSATEEDGVEGRGAFVVTPGGVVGDSAGPGQGGGTIQNGDGSTLDQSFIAPGDLSGLINACCTFIGQTFTAGITGRLTGVNVRVQGYGEYPLRVAIRSVEGGVPSAVTLGETIVPGGSAPLSLLVPFATPIPVVAGRLYAIVVDYPDQPRSGLGSGSWGGATGYHYSRGTAFRLAHLPIPGQEWTWVGMCPGCDLHFQTYVEPPNRAPNCAGARARLAEAWPPDGKLVPVDIEGIVDPDGDPLRIEATGVTQDEPLEGACPSAVIVNGAARVRASRLGSGNGRVYAVAFVARDGRGGECSGSVTVCVPHDRGRGSVCVDDGQTVDALGPCRSEHEVEPAEICLNVLRRSGTTAVLQYSLPMDAEVLLSVYDVAGRRVRTLKRAHDAAGVHQVSWDTGGIVAGVYFYRLRIGDRTTGGPLIVIR